MRRLAERGASGGILDAMIDRVADEMHERGQQAIRDRLVELRVARIDLEPDVPAGAAGEAADEQRQRLEHLGDAHHPRAQDRATQVAELSPLDSATSHSRRTSWPARGECGDLALESQARYREQRELLLEVVEPGQLDAHERATDHRHGLLVEPHDRRRRLG